ncbi:MAG: DUF4407 domain-containing protein [Chitinophagales bacterium]
MNNNNQNAKDKHFLWSLAGYEPEILKSCKVDQFHVSIISIMLIIVGIYAALAWIFFFSSVTNILPVALVGGIFMGVFIVCFDRALIASLSSGNASFLSLAFRFCLALLLGIFLSQPMIHKIYEPEIKREAQILMDQKVLERKEELERVYASEVETLIDQKTELEDQLSAKLLALNTAESDFKSEMDGSGGTEKYGYSTVAKQKQRILLRHQKEYENLQTSLNPQILDINKEIKAFEEKVTEETATYQAGNQMFGSLLQAEALKSLMAKDGSNTLRNHFYLLSLILILIELSALIAKLIFKTNSYSAKIRYAELREVKTTEVEEEMLIGKLEKYKALTTHNDLDIMEDFYSKSRDINDEKLDEMLKEWETNKTGSFSNYWKAFEEKFLVHH